MEMCHGGLSHLFSHPITYIKQYFVCVYGYVYIIAVNDSVGETPYHKQHLYKDWYISSSPPSIWSSNNTSKYQKLSKLPIDDINIIFFLTQGVYLF